jgi:hypothetical protein
MWMLSAPGALLALVGLVMMGRGWSYSLAPEGPRALKRKAKNIQMGFATDMRLFGRKVRRLGTILVVVGAVLVSSHWW